MSWPQHIPEVASEAVLRHSEPVPLDIPQVKGVDYSKREAYNMKAVDLVRSMRTMGLQATSVGQACDIVNEMQGWRGQHISELEEYQIKGSFDDNGYQKTTIFLGFTSNLISSGIRDTLRYLVQHKKVSAIVSTAGGIEEDLIKVLAPTFMGDFNLSGSILRDKGLNRIGNMLVPNDNYCRFEEWVIPILDKCLEEQEEELRKLGPEAFQADSPGFWTPSKLVARLGKEINDESSVMYWAYKNNIPVFCPALTDGSLGDMLFMHTFRASPLQLRLDIVADVRKINSFSMESSRAGMIILGGGLIKHHICNACLMRNGADYAVYINTAQEFDGSDAGARPDEAVSWGKIRTDAQQVKVCADVSIVFPLIVAATFAAEPPS